MVNGSSSVDRLFGSGWLEVNHPKTPTKDVKETDRGGNVECIIKYNFIE